MKAQEVVSASEWVRGGCACTTRTMRPGKSRPRVAGPVTSVALALGAALLPKCPLCIAAALSALGVGAAVSHGVAPWLRPLAIAFSAVVAIAWMWRTRRTSAHRAASADCCTGRRLPRTDAIPSKREKCRYRATLALHSRRKSISLGAPR